MRKVFIYLFLITLLCFQINCAKNAADNSNQVDANLTTANSNQTAQETPLPAFTNADEALAAGKKLLDDLEAEKAIEVFKQAVNLNPDLAEAHFNLGIAYALKEKNDEQNPPSSLEPTPTPETKKKGKETVVLSASEKSFQNAVKAYKKILAENPKDAAAHFNLGRSYNKLNEDPEALKSLQQAVKLNPEDTEYQTELGAILIKLAQYAEAVAALKKAIELDETNLQAESLLEKAEAGRKRVEFGNKPKPSPQPGQPKPKESSSPAANSKPAEAPTPAKKNVNKQ